MIEPRAIYLESVVSDSAFSGYKGFAQEIYFTARREIMKRKPDFKMSDIYNIDDKEAREKQRKYFEGLITKEQREIEQYWSSSLIVNRVGDDILFYDIGHQEKELYREDDYRKDFYDLCFYWILFSTEIIDLKNFLEYQLAKSFSNNKQEFVYYINSLIRNYTDKFEFEISTKTIEEIKEWSMLEQEREEDEKSTVPVSERILMAKYLLEASGVSTSNTDQKEITKLICHLLDKEVDKNPDKTYVHKVLFHNKIKKSTQKKHLENILKLLIKNSESTDKVVQLIKKDLSSLK